VTTSDTPDTDANTWSDSSEGVLFKVVSAEFAKRLERERDEAREVLQAVIKTGKRLERERDEAREKIERQADIGCAFQKTNPAMCGRYKQERDESQEKYATEATEHMLAVNKLCNERDEAREEIKRLKVILDLIKKDVS
jgi:hypothetical protein